MSTDKQTFRRLFIARQRAVHRRAVAEEPHAAPTDADPIFEALGKVARARAAYEQAEGAAQDAAYGALGDAEVYLL